MAEDKAQSRTEEATPRRREDARDKGQVAFSQELTGSAVLLTGVVALVLIGDEIGGALLTAFRHGLSEVVHESLAAEDFRAMAGQMIGLTSPVLTLFFLALVAVGVGSGLAQVGLHLTPTKIEPDLERVSPAKGLKRVFSAQGLVKAGLSVLKVAALVVIAWVVLRGRAGSVLAMHEGSIHEAVGAAWGLVLRLAGFLAGALLLLGLFDYAYQKHRFEASLKMTKQEVKEEHKREEGDPLVRSKLRQIQRERAGRKSLAEVASATVVVRNPTHIAVALRYRRGQDVEPVLVAKGTGLRAEQITTIARRHSVPVIERPPVARALFKSVREGQSIPVELFQAVAELIAFVYRLTGRN